MVQLMIEDPDLGQDRQTTDARTPDNPTKNDTNVVDSAGGDGLVILVVDDNSLIATTTAALLEDLGHRAIGCTSGVAALAALDAVGKVDLVITDYSMPGMSGTELARILHERLPRLPIALATGHPSLPMEEHSDLPRLGKPYGEKELVELIQKLCP